MSPCRTADRCTLARRTLIGLGVAVVLLIVITDGLGLRPTWFFSLMGGWLILGGLHGIYFRRENAARTRAFWSIFYGENDWRVRIATPQHNLFAGAILLIAGVVFVIIGVLLIPCPGWFDTCVVHPSIMLFVGCASPVAVRPLENDRS